MKTYELAFVLTECPRDEQTDTLYGTLGDCLVSSIGGVHRFELAVEAASLETAIETVARQLVDVGCLVSHVEVVPDIPLAAAS